MKAHLGGFRAGPTSPLEEATAALRAATTDDGPPLLLSYTPVARVNPYQDLLYRSFDTAGVAVSPVLEAARFPDVLAVGALAARVALHLHWTSFVLAGAGSAAEADELLGRFTERLDDFRGRGGRLVWTVHNVVPHDAVHLEHEHRLQQHLADSADVVHVMSAATLDVLADRLHVPASKAVVVPHPSYVGAYPDYVSRRDARAALGIGPDEVVYVVLGALKAYKGLGRLLDAFDQVSSGPGPRRRLLLAGSPDSSAEMAGVLAAARAHPLVLLHEGTVASHHVQYYLRAADIGVAAYSRTLNSGAAVLYQSFGLPVVAASSPAVWENLAPDVAEPDPGGGADRLAGALLRAERLRGPDVAVRVMDHVRAFDPARLSLRLGEELRTRLLDGPTRTSTTTTARRNED